MIKKGRGTQTGLVSLTLALLALGADSFATLTPEAGTNVASAPSESDALFPNKRSSFVPTGEELYKKLLPATVRVTLKKFDVPVIHASGFFVTTDGLLLVPRSILQTAMADTRTTLEFTVLEKTGGEKRAIKEFKVASCGNTRDGVATGPLCAVQLSFTPKTIFTFTTDEPHDGQSAVIIGFPKNGEAIVSHGTLEVLKSPARLGLRAAVFATLPGAPVLDDHGHLLAAMNRAPDDRDDDKATVKMLTTQATLQDLIKKSEIPMQSLAEARKHYQDSIRAELRRRTTEDLDPALAFAARSKLLHGLNGFKEVAMKFDDSTLQMSLPAAFDDCAFTIKSRESTQHACFAYEGAVTLTVQRLSGKGYEDLLLRNGKRLVEPHPVTGLEELMHSDDWTMYEPLLTAEQTRALHSVPSQAQCQLVRKSALSHAAFSDVPACRFSIAQDGDPGSSSISVWLLKDQFLYSVSVWMNDTVMSDYLSRLPSLAILTARWDQQAPIATLRSLASEIGNKLTARPQPTYRIALPETLSFMGAKVADKKTRSPQMDLYGKKLLLDQFEEGFLVAVTSHGHAVLPPDYDDVARRNALEVASALGAKIALKTVELEPITADGRASRLLTAFARDKKGESILILSAAVFFADQSFEITEVAHSKDAAETFKEFKALLLGFKRQ